MNANGRELILKDEVYSIISCALEIINGLGHGLHEKPYENSLAVEFQHRGIPFVQQPKFPILWRETLVGQMLNYLRITGLPVGLLINFKKPKLEWERIVLSS
jgi:hypothetical protein